MLTTDRPEPVVEVEARRLAQEIHVGLPVGRDRADVAPVRLFFVRLFARHLVLLEVVREDSSARHELRDDRAAEVVIGRAPGIRD